MPKCDLGGRIENAARLMDNAALELRLAVAEQERPDNARLEQMAQLISTAGEQLWRAARLQRGMGNL